MAVSESYTKALGYHIFADIKSSVGYINGSSKLSRHHHILNIGQTEKNVFMTFMVVNLFFGNLFRFLVLRVVARRSELEKPINLIIVVDELVKVVGWVKVLNVMKKFKLKRRFFNISITYLHSQVQLVDNFSNDDTENGTSTLWTHRVSILLRITSCTSCGRSIQLFHQCRLVTHFQSKHLLCLVSIYKVASFYSICPLWGLWPQKAGLSIFLNLASAGQLGVPH